MQLAGYFSGLSFPFAGVVLQIAPRVAGLSSPFALRVVYLSCPFVVGVVQFAGDFPPIVVVVMLFDDGVVVFAVDIRPSAGVGVLTAGFDYLSAGIYYQGCVLDR